MKNTPKVIQQSVNSLVLALDDLAEIEAQSIATDREERGGVLCYNPKTKKYNIKKIESTNDSVINSPSLTVNGILNLCKEDDVITFWHTHGTSLHSFSDLDRYSAADLTVSGRKVGLCSLGIDGIHCHYAFLGLPQIVNIQWDGRLRKKLKEIAKEEYLVDDLICDSNLDCQIRNWSKGMAKEPLESFDQINSLKGTTSAIDKSSGIIVSSHQGMVCYNVLSGDGFKSLNCFGREEK